MYGPEPKQPPQKKPNNSHPNHNHPGLLNCWATTIHPVTVWRFCAGKRVVPFLLSSASGSPPGVTSSAVSRSRRSGGKEPTVQERSKDPKWKSKPQKKAGTSSK